MADNRHVIPGSAGKAKVVHKTPAPVAPEAAPFGYDLIGKGGRKVVSNQSSDACKELRQGIYAETGELCELHPSPDPAG